jgi:hypothetical protein
MNISSIFIDENILDIGLMSKINDICKNINFFYIKIDPITIKHNKTKLIKKLEESNSYFYLESKNYNINLKKIICDNRFIKKFHLI